MELTTDGTAVQIEWWENFKSPCTCNSAPGLTC